MSTIGALGTYSRQLTTINSITAQQRQLEDLTRQLTSGKKSVELQRYGGETQRLLDLRTELVERRAYITAIDTTIPRVKAADLVLDRLDSIASDLMTSALQPGNLGQPKVDDPVDIDPERFSIEVIEEQSTFTQETKYTVTAVPSSSGPNGSYDITIDDGLGGRATGTVGLGPVPPEDGYRHTFVVGGGPGDGNRVTLSFDTLITAGTSSFDVSWPDSVSARRNVEAHLKEIQALLNERVEDRYLFSGSRYNQAPVDDLMKFKQVTNITLTGTTGRVGDIYEIRVDGQQFFYPNPTTNPGGTTGSEAGLEEIAEGLRTELESAVPSLNVVIGQRDGVLTITNLDEDQSLDIEAEVHRGIEYANHMTKTPSEGAADAYTITLGSSDSSGAIDIGDTFSITVKMGPTGEDRTVVGTEAPTLSQNIQYGSPNHYEKTVSYTVTPEDYLSGGVTTIIDVRDRLLSDMASHIPELPITINAGTNPEDIDITAPGGKFNFITEVKVEDGRPPNTMVVQNRPPEPSPPSIRTEPVTAPTLPFYDAERPALIENSRAYDTVRVAIDERRTVDYGIVSTDPAFQDLIAGMRFARAAVENPGQYDAYIDQAQTLINRGRAGLRDLQAKNASNLATMEHMKDDHSGLMNSISERIATIEGVDKIEVAARLQSASTTLEATYTVIARTQQLSLINFTT